MKKIKRLIGGFLVFAILTLSCNSVVYAYDLYITQCDEKIADDLKMKLQTVSVDESVPVAIWCAEADLSDVEENTFEQMGITRDYFENLSTSNLSNEEQMQIVQEFIATKRSLISDIYEEQNAAYINKFDSSINIEYASSYAPVLIANIQIDEIKDMTRTSFVEDIYLNDYEMVSELDISRTVVKAHTMQEFDALLGYTGAGVKVGVLESDESGLSDNSLIGLDESKFNVDPNCPTVTNEHANVVSMIIASQGLNGNATGIAPGVALYSTYDSTGTQFAQKVNWLVNSGVNIINISFGYKNPLNTYTWFDEFVDYISYSSNVLFVISAGNEGMSGVTSPGMAYNAITVANINDKNTKSVSDDALYSSSSYINSLEISTASKPDISAPGTNIYTTEYGNSTGTSYAAPHITGLAALLCEQNAMLVVIPFAIKAILTAGVYNNHAYVPSNRIVSSNSSSPASSYIQYGAGIANCVGAATIILNESFDFGCLLTSTVSTTYIVSCSEGKNVRVSLSFMNKVTSSSGGYLTYDLPNLDIEVYDPSGNKIAQSATTNNNLEIVDFTATADGDYTVKIERKSATGSYVYYGIAWT